MGKQFCNGFEFELTKQWKFRVDEFDKEFASYDEMVTYLDKAKSVREAAGRKAVAKFEPVEIVWRAYDEMKTGTITGIHAGHGKPILKGGEKAGWHPSFYPGMMGVDDE